jgi:hypothetical protein
MSAALSNADGDLAELAALVQPVTRRDEQRLPLHPALAPLLPDGLQRGSTLTVEGRGSTALLLLLVAEASAAGAWTAAAGFQDLGVVAAAELGVALDRLALIPRVPARAWATVVAALLDGVELVLVRPPPQLRPVHTRRLAGLARQRGALLVVAGGWPDPPDVRLVATASRWYGLEHGFLRARRLEVTSAGRGAASRPRRAALWLPGVDGHPAPARLGADPPERDLFPLPPAAVPVPRRPSRELW